MLKFSELDRKRAAVVVKLSKVIGLAVLLGTLSTNAMAEGFPSAATSGFVTVFGAPSAVPIPSGTAYAALTYATPREAIAGKTADGDLSFGFTGGNPVTGIGLTFGVDITGLDPLGDAGSFSVQASRLLGITETTATFAAISYSGFGGWGAQRGQEKLSIYATTFGTVGSANPKPYLLTIGYGQDTQYTGFGTGVLEDSIFWGAGIGLTENLSASLSGTTNQVNFGVGVRLLGLENISISAGVLDVTDAVDRRQTSITIGYSFNNLFGK